MRLPKDEWDYGTQPDEVARGMFFYEYLRTSEKLRNLVLRCREIEGPAELGESLPGFKPLTMKMRQLIKSELGGRTEFEYVIGSLMNNQKFPKTPALRIRRKEWLRWLRDLGHSPTLHSCGGEVFDAADQGYAIRQILGVPGIEYRFNGSVETKDFESVFPLVIDWRRSDRQIINAFKAKVLSRRPENFSPFAAVSPKQNPFGDALTKLPFRAGNALLWLGVLRRRNSVNTWKDYFDLYSGVPFSRGAERAREEDCRKARLILEWLENGVPLDPRKFR